MQYKMSERLKDIIETYLIRAGKNGVLRLSIESGCSLRTIYLIKNNGHVPGPQRIYKLALACGCSEGEALRMSKESAPLKAKRAG